MNDRNYWLAILERYGEKSSGNRWIVKRRATQLLLIEIIPLIDSRLSNASLEALASTSWFIRRQLVSLASLRLKSFSPWYCWLRVRCFYFEVWDNGKRIFQSRLSKLPVPFRIGRSLAAHVRVKDRAVSRHHLVVERVQHNTLTINVVGKYGARLDKKSIKAKQCLLHPGTPLYFLKCYVQVVEHFE